MDKEFEIDFSIGSAKRTRITKKGNKIVDNYKIFTDQKGLYVLTQNAVIYLTEENSKIK